jgi:hypothetical protein
VGIRGLMGWGFLLERHKIRAERNHTCICVGLDVTSHYYRWILILSLINRQREG